MIDRQIGKFYYKSAIGDALSSRNANSASLDESVLQAVGATDPNRLCIKGLEKEKHFVSAIIDENGLLDFERIEAEVVTTAKEMINEEPAVGAILLECSVLPPYAWAVQEAVNLPVFDYITMINFVYSAVVKKSYTGFM